MTPICTVRVFVYREKVPLLVLEMKNLIPYIVFTAACVKNSGEPRRL